MQVERARGFVNVRFWGAFMAAKYGSPHIRPGGSITLTNGIAGLRPRKGWTVAASICGAMEALTRALAVELAPIRVNAVCPGTVRPRGDLPLPDAGRLQHRPGARRRRRRGAGVRRRVHDAPLSATASTSILKP